MAVNTIAIDAAQMIVAADNDPPGWGAGSSASTRTAGPHTRHSDRDGFVTVLDGIGRGPAA